MNTSLPEIVKAAEESDWHVPKSIPFDIHWFQIAKLLPTHNEKLTFLMDLLSNEFAPTLGWDRSTVRDRVLERAARRIASLPKATSKT